MHAFVISFLSPVAHRPGATDTALMVSQVDSDAAMRGLMQAIPIGRMAAPEEVRSLH